MNIDKAIEKLQQGKAVTRKKWDFNVGIRYNEKKQRLEYIGQEMTGRPVSHNKNLEPFEFLKDWYIETTDWVVYS